MTGMEPPRPRDLYGASPRELLEAWHGHVALLVDARHGLRDRPTSVGRLRSAALEALAVGQALVDVLQATRWVTVVDGLTYGAGVGDIAASMGLDVDEVVIGLQSWADGQLGEGLMTPAAHDVVLSLVRGPV